MQRSKDGKIWISLEQEFDQLKVSESVEFFTDNLDTVHGTRMIIFIFKKCQKD